MSILFETRRNAGEVLATRLRQYAERTDVLVLALPRGGVPVGFEVARALHAELDVFLVRKLGVPGHEELAMGAIAAGGVRVLDEELMIESEIPTAAIEAVVCTEQKELERQERLYRRGRAPLDVHGRTVILVDDGLATGATMRAAAIALRQMHPGKIVVAVPLGAPEICDEFGDEADEVICAATPEPFLAVGAWYADFSQTNDTEVQDLLHEAAKFRHESSAALSNGI